MLTTGHGETIGETIGRQEVMGRKIHILKLCFMYKISLKNYFKVFFIFVDQVPIKYIGIS